MVCVITRRSGAHRKGFHRIASEEVHVAPLQPFQLAASAQWY